MLKAIAVFPPGLECEGVKELSRLGAKDVLLLKRSAAFHADMACFYRLHLQARLPFRLFREISRFQCRSRKDLYKGVQHSLDWARWLMPSMSFRVDVSGGSNYLNHSHFSALQVKNALVDLQRQFWGERSSIDLEKPDLCIHLHISQTEAVLSLDGSGGSLHRRGYRTAMGVAPIKENIAAGLILLSGWDGNVPLVDPMCGSATLLIEAVSLALGLPQGLRRSFLLHNWADFDSRLWEDEKKRAKKSQRWNKKLPPVIGSERDEEIAKHARINVISAGLEEIIKIENIDFKKLAIPRQEVMIVCNPPYGKRVGFDEDIQSLYHELGSFAKQFAAGSQLWLLSGNPNLTEFIRMKSSSRFPISNGGIDCRWLKYLVR